MQELAKWVRKDQSGFTLIELLVVVAILALLGAVAIPRIMAAQDHAKTKAAEANKGILEAAIEQYYIMHDGAYPVLADDATAAQLLDLLEDVLEIENAATMVAKFNVDYASNGTTYTLDVSKK